MDDFLADVRRGHGRALLLHGEAGIGKTALLRHLIESASEMTIIQAAGVESEMELANASLHQLSATLLGRLERLPDPQRQALEIVYGLSKGPPPDRFLVGLGMLTLFSEVSGERPLLCVIDDAQWLDQASALTLAFVARRLLAERVGIALATREAGEALQGVPELEVRGLANDDARALLGSVVPFKLDERIRDRIVAETRGNPLALLELPRGLTASQLAGGFGLEEARGLPGQIEQNFVRRLGALPAETRQLLLLAAAEPVGDPLLLWRAAQTLGIRARAARAAEADGWLAIDEKVTFRHPLIRSAVYGAAASDDRRAIHLALAGATDRDIDPDRRAWHLAAAAAGPEERIAVELERSADRAQARGGLAAAAAFLRRASSLSSDRPRRAARLAAAASALRDAGAVHDALTLLDSVETDALDDIARAKAVRLRGQIAFDQLRCGEAARLLLTAAKMLEPLDASLARMTLLDALGAATWVGEASGPGGTRAVSRAALAAPLPLGPPTAQDVLLDGFALLLTKGYRSAAPSLRRSLELVSAESASDDHYPWLAFAVTGGNAVIAAQELWDAEEWHVLSTHREQITREHGALRRLQFALDMSAWVQVIEGDLTHAELLLEEGRLIAEAAGNPPSSPIALLIAAFQGNEPRATELIEATAREATARDLGRWNDFAAYGRAVLYNGLARHMEARDVIRPAFERGHAGLGPYLVPELAEAAARTGDTALLSSALDWLAVRTATTPSDWCLGIEARIQALRGEGDAADESYRKSINHLQRTRIGTELARSHLLYGEWLRRQGRRVDARSQLRTAHQQCTLIGMEAFAERARKELLATGAKTRKRTVETRDDLTAQERQIAELAKDGLSNPEIGARLFLSPRTVEWHLRKVFGKLGIHYRQELTTALSPSDLKRERPEIDVNGRSPSSDSRSGPPATERGERR